MKTKKRILFILFWMMSFPLFLLHAQNVKKDTLFNSKSILIQELLYKGPISIPKPIFSDSVNMDGEKFDVDNLYKYIPDVGKTILSFPKKITAKDGYFYLSDLIKTDQSNPTMHLLGAYFLANTFAEGQIEIDCNIPWELFIDHKSICSNDGLHEISKHDISLTPTLHQMFLKLMPASSSTTPQQVKIKINYIPKRQEPQVSILTAPKRYPDLPYMIWGESLTGTNISPSGKYVIVYDREYINKKAQHSSILYDASGKVILRIPKEYGTVRWMPKLDKLYFSKEGAEGRALLAYDPVRRQIEIISNKIPEGNFTMAPNGETLIYFTMEKGPKYNKKTLDLFSTPDERMSGFRTRQFLSLYELKTGIYRPLTYGYRSTLLQDINFEGNKIIYSVSTSTPEKSPFRNNSFFELDLNTMSLDTLFYDSYDVSEVRYTSQTGSLLIGASADAFGGIGKRLKKDQPVNSFDKQIFLYNRSTQESVALSKDFNRTISQFTCPKNSFVVYFTAEDGDRKPLYKIDLSTKKIIKLSEHEDYVKSFSISEKGILSYVGQSAMNSDRAYMVDTNKKTEKCLFDLSLNKMKYMQLGAMKDWDWTAPDGTNIQGRYYLPPNFDPQKEYPMIVYYYGGTSPVQRVFEGSYSLPMYAALGYVVYTMNPSGSTGYGQEYAARHINAWGDITADEIIGAVKDFCKVHHFVNKKKIGCMGASYGGFMTQYLQTKTDLFAAAVSHAGISNIASYWGVGFWGVGYSSIATMDNYPWNNPQFYTQHSPLYLAQKINTPLLLIHGLADTNVPVGESWQMFNALRTLGKPVEFIGVYEQDHHIIDPDKRYEWSSAIMAFFAKYLQDDPTWWNHLFPHKNL